MPLASIQDINGGFGKYMFDHWWDHLEILQAIKAQLGVSLPERPIFPWSPRSPSTWAWNHQAMHNEMNGALGISSADLSQVDFENREIAEAWIDQNYLEHSNAREALGI